jgi:hypothetical protein
MKKLGITRESLRAYRQEKREEEELERNRQIEMQTD